MSEWRAVDAMCKHCQLALEARPRSNPGNFHIGNGEPMEFRHVGGKQECSVAYRAMPASEWGMYHKWKNAK